MKPLVTNLRFIVQPLTKGNHTFLDEEEKFQERLLRESEKTFSTHTNHLHPPLRKLQEHVIKDCVVGPKHLAFLLEDGTVCRVSYAAAAPSTASHKLSDEPNKDKSYPSKSGSVSRWGNRIGVIRSSSSSSGANTTSSSSARKTIRGSTNTTSTDSVTTSSGLRLIRTGQVRGRNLLTGQKVVVPASQVPEDLINQVQSVLQGKTRSVIVRELQRTHLDVNLAVNNLLSRDDEDNDDMDDSASDYIPGEELMSLLDGGVSLAGEHPRVVIDADAMLPEDLLGYTFTSRPTSSSRRIDHDGLEDGDDGYSRYTGSHWSEAVREGEAGSHQDSGLSLGEELEWWKEGEELVKFKQIGAMFSELAAVDVTGRLRQWKWASSDPYHSTTFHPRSSSLNLVNEKVLLLSSCLIQASVVTMEGAVATWVDESVASHSVSLDLPCLPCDSLKSEKVKSLHVCSLYSAVLTEQGRVYWWGVLPFYQRKKVIERTQGSLHQTLDKETGSAEEITIGSQVCLRSFPVYHAGAIAINVSDGAPKVGRLLQSMWSMDGKQSFEILSSNEEAAADAESDGAAMTTSGEDFGGTPTLKKWETLADNSKLESGESRKRKRSSDEDGKEEMWDVRDVVFIEDVRSVPVGKVYKVDKNIVAVRFSEEEGKSDEDPMVMLESCRLLHKEDVIPVKSSSPKVTDCVQKTPRRLQLDPHTHLHCICAQEHGLAALVGRPNEKLSYVTLSLASGKMMTQRPFPTNPESFLREKRAEAKPSRLPAHCRLVSCCQSSPTLLQDYNAMLYPLLGDENGGIHDPIWADIPPLFALGMGIHSDPIKGRSTVSVLAFQSQVLMPLIMRRDLKGFQTFLSSVEANQDASWTKVFYESLRNDRCDGQRNVLHMCIEMSIPSSNKEQKEDEKEKSEKNKPPTKPPPPPRSKSGTSPGHSGSSFLNIEEKMEAVNAIASAISSATKRPSSSDHSSPSRSATSSTAAKSSTSLPSDPLPCDDASTFSDMYRSACDVLNKMGSPPGSPILTWPPEATWKSAGGDRKAEEEGMNLTTSSRRRSKDTWTEVTPPEKERGSRLDAVEMLRLMCSSKCIRPHLGQLLTHKDSTGYTPFMFAVAYRAYPAALVLFKAAFNLSMEVSSDDGRDKSAGSAPDYSLEPANQDALLPMLYPAGSNPDDNPLHMLCCNDTCSFTWTGANHINQDIFECLTCGLTETLCCCTECARVCHKGHDCKLKRTSPTAYCDCWEKCACKSLVEGSGPDRMALLRMLLHTTSLYERFDSSGQHVIHFLVQTVGRQCEEQRQYRPPPRTARMTVSAFRSRISRIAAKSNDQDLPEHDLRPPQFCRDALLQLLGDWHAVRSLLFSGCKNRRDRLSMSHRLDAEGSFVSLLPEDEELISNQSGTVRLDSFTHSLVVECSSGEYLDRLLETLIHAVQVNKHRDHDDGVIMTRRFLRSVIRVFIVLTAQSTPDKLAAKPSLYNQSAIAKCKRAFTALITLAVEELCEAAESLIAPVRMGVSRPTAPYTLAPSSADVVHDTSSVFSRLPFPPRRAGSEDEEDGDGAKKPKPSSKKVRKRSKHHKTGRSSSRRRSSSRHGERRAEESREATNDEPSQDTQPVEEEETLAGFNQLFQDMTERMDSETRDVANEEESDADLTMKTDQGDAEGANEEESDMDLTDIELAPESDSDSVDSDFSEQPTMFLGGSHIGESNRDEEDDDAGDEQKRNDDEDTDSDNWQDEVNLERRQTREQRAQTRQAPHTMQWAMGRTSMVPVKPPGQVGRSSMMGPGNYVNSRSLRRNDSSIENAYINSLLDRQHGLPQPKPASPDALAPSSSVTSAQLSRLFATCVREVAQLLSSLQKGSYVTATSLNTILEVSFKESSELRAYVQRFMEQTWRWLLAVVESTECQLRFGQVVSMASSPSHSHHPHHKGRASRRGSSTSGRHGNMGASEDSAARQDFLSYVLSLMRSHSNEHSDLLPTVDISSLKHVAYVLDAYIYFLRSMSSDEDAGKMEEAAASKSNSISLDIGYDNSENEEEEEEESLAYTDDLYSAVLQPDPVKPAPLVEDLSGFAQPPASFFRRSESMTFLGCSDPQTFEVPLPSALPLAEKPHLLRPSSRKEELFGRPRVPSSSAPAHHSSMSLSTRTAPDGESGDVGGKDALKRKDTYKKDEEGAKSSLATEDGQPPPCYSSVEASSGISNPDVAPTDPTDEVEDLSIHPAESSSKPHDAVSAPLPGEEAMDGAEEPKTSGGSDPGSVAIETPPPGATVTVVMAPDDGAEASSNQATSSRVNESELTSELRSAHQVLGRCRLTLELFSRAFLDNVGAEPRSILYELGGFEVRESKFRKEMERLRTAQTVDLLLNVDRGRNALVQQTFKQLNLHAKRRSSASQPLAVLRVKVLFDNEPGEGTGVARSFYTAICEALLSPERLPSLEGVLPGSVSSSKMSSSSSIHLSLVARLYKREREREERAGRAGSSRAGSSGNRNINLRSFLTARYRELATGGRRASSSMDPLSTQAPPYVKRKPGNRQGCSAERNKQAIGDRLSPKVSAIQPEHVAKITGMLLELPAYELLLLLRSERALQDRVAEATDLLRAGGYSNREEDAQPDPQPTEPHTATGESLELKKPDEKAAKVSDKDEEATASGEAEGGPPLFYQPGKRGVYAPASWGDASDARLNAFRNVGRILGLCLLQNELCPLPLCRHVLKVILGRKVHWHDLAFFDPALYESLRQLVMDTEQDGGAEVLASLDLSCLVDLQSEEGGNQVELVADGANVSVNKSNLLEYVRKYALHRMVGCCKLHLEKLRQGVYDVLPKSSVSNLTSEDLRLLLNGCGEVEVRTLISYTLFNDESGKTGSSAEKLTQFKRWFWSVVDKLGHSERQDLLYFWTGSPALPASEDGFQPMPTITIRPPDDQHLPTANTCISRLYVPLYSTKQILRQKLLVAIKTKNFGFV